MENTYLLMRKSGGVPEASWLTIMFPKIGYPTHQGTSLHCHLPPSKIPKRIEVTQHTIGG